MILHWNNIDATYAQAICLGGGTRMPVTMALRSLAIQKDFVDHDPGGSDG